MERLARMQQQRMGSLGAGTAATTTTTTAAAATIDLDADAGDVKDEGGDEDMQGGGFEARPVVGVGAGRQAVKAAAGGAGSKRKVSRCPAHRVGRHSGAGLGGREGRKVGERGRGEQRVGAFFR